MPLKLPKPITYLITSGETTARTAPSTEDFARLLKLVSAAVAARVNLIQLREKNLKLRVLYELAVRAAAITRGSSTRLLVNERADIARAAGADGVHLSGRSLAAAIVRGAFGAGFLIGASTHSLAEARSARAGGADFAVFGPVFETGSKRIYGAPVGLENLKETARELAPFPIIALGGVTINNASACMRAGAAGIAGITLFNQARDLQRIVRLVQDDSS